MTKEEFDKLEDKWQTVYLDGRTPIQMISKKSSKEDYILWYDSDEYAHTTHYSRITLELSDFEKEIDRLNVQNMENKIYIRITQATDTEGRMPYKFFADAIVPSNYIKVDKHKNIKGDFYYLLYLTEIGKIWFKNEFNKNWDGYFSLYDTKYNPNNPLEQYYEEVKNTKNRLNYLNSLI